MDEIYCYDGINVLRNKLGIQDGAYTTPETAENGYDKYGTNKHEVRPDGYEN